MPQALVNLSSKEYPGRLIIIGQDRTGEKAIIVYAITGRSPSSQARRMVEQTDGIWVRPTDEDILRKGNPDLLIYPALLYGQGIAVSNGKQTTDVKNSLSVLPNPVDVLKSALSGWDYEPDEPTFTPRISGCVLPNAKAALSVIRRAEDGFSLRNYFGVSLSPGKGKLVSTYSGENIDPLPPYTGEPEEILLDKNTAQETVHDVYEALSPKEHAKDFRVSVVSVFIQPEDPTLIETAIINRSERNGNG
ncbi:IMP cyclohydrolase [Acidobacteriota bacterium]